MSKFIKGWILVPLSNECCILVVTSVGGIRRIVGVNDVEFHFIRIKIMWQFKGSRTGSWGYRGKNDFNEWVGVLFVFVRVEIDVVSFKGPFSGKKVETDKAFIHTFPRVSVFGVQMIKNGLSISLKPEIAQVTLLERIHVWP